MAARVELLVVGGACEPWERLGFTLVEATIHLDGAGVRVEGGQSPGVLRWELSGLDRPDGEEFHIDGLPTVAVLPTAPVLVHHDLGVYDIDHVVIATGDLARTCGAIADATGSPLKRVRETDTVRQGFHRLGNVIVEVVETVTQAGGQAAGRAGDGSASFFGIAFNADGLDGAPASIDAGLLGAPRDAVQPGRRIATVRSTAGLGVPVAVMTVADR